MGPAMEKLRTRPEVPVAATDQDNLAMAERVPNSFAGTTLLQFLTENPRLHPIALDGKAGSVEAMEDKTYRLSMRLHVVTKANATPGARRFLEFLRSPAAEKVIRESGGARVKAFTAAALQ